MHVAKKCRLFCLPSHFSRDITDPDSLKYHFGLSYSDVWGTYYQIIGASTMDYMYKCSVINSFIEAVPVYHPRVKIPPSYVSLL